MTQRGPTAIIGCLSMANQSPEATNATAQSVDGKSKARQNIESILVAVLIALAIRSTLVEAFWVPSGSMLPTIQIGDYLFVNKVAYALHVDVPLVNKTFHFARWRGPSRGDIAVFVSPKDRNLDLIKRIVAVAGDTVEVRKKKLYINNEAVPDLDAHYNKPYETDLQPRDNFGPVTVPEGKFFAMGDNRDDSNDSRYWGFANETDIKGKAMFIYWSGLGRVNRMGHWLN